MDLYFQKLLKFPRKIQTINAQCNNTWQKVTRFIAEFKKLSSCAIKWYHKFSSEFCICIYSKLTNLTTYKRPLTYHPFRTTDDTMKHITNQLMKLNKLLVLTIGYGCTKGFLKFLNSNLKLWKIKDRYNLFFWPPQK